MFPGLQRPLRSAGGTQKRSSDVGPKTHPSISGELSVKDGNSGLVPVVPQIRTVLSFEAEAIYLPSGEIEMSLIALACPSSGPMTVSAVSASHTRIVPSYEPEAMCFPSGKKATDQT